MDMNISSLEVEKMRNWKQALSSCSCLECKERLWEWHAEVTDDYDVFQEVFDHSRNDQKLTAAVSDRQSAQTTGPSP